jgi:hypothetical protein
MEAAMPRRNRWMLLVPIIVALPLAACEKGASKPAKIRPAQVERVEGSELSRVTLTEKAAERLGIETDLAGRKVVPYAAVLYDAKGVTWVYTSPANLVFVRHRITVDYIEGDTAVLTDGPPAGTRVVTVGGQELFGAEFEIGH